MSLYWITGLPGAGKTTIAKMLHQFFIESSHVFPIFLDGDRLREILGIKGGYSRDERKQIAFVYSRLCKELSDQGFCVIIATVSLINDIHTWNRENIDDYIEIVIEAPIETIFSRNQKGLYSTELKDKNKNVVGLDITPEFPPNPDCIISNDGKKPISYIFKQVLKTIPLPEDIT